MALLPPHAMLLDCCFSMRAIFIIARLLADITPPDALPRRHAAMPQAYADIDCQLVIFADGDFHAAAADDYIFFRQVITLFADAAAATPTLRRHYCRRLHAAMMMFFAIFAAAITPPIRH